MSVQSEVKEKNSEQENEIRREETRKEEKQDDTAQVSEERVETKELLEAGESIKEEKEAEQMTVEDLEASKHIISEGQESIVEKAPTIVEILREADVEGREALKQEQICAEEGNIKQVKDIKEEIVQMNFSEKACIEETKSEIQERTDIEERERVIEINVELVKDVMPTEIVVKEQIKNVIPAKEHIKDETSEHTATKGQVKNVTLTDTITKDTSYVQQTLYVKEVNVEQKAEAIYEEQGERGSKTGVREAAQKCSSQPHTLPSPQNETENDSDLEFFNFEDFEVVDALEDEEEEEEEVGKNDGKSKPLSSTSRRQERRSNSPHRRENSHHNSSRSSRSHHSHSSHSRDRLKRSREDAKDKSGNSSRSSRNSSRHREDRSRHGHSRNQRKRGEDKSSDECRQCQKSPRNAHERDKTQVRKRSTDDEGRSSKRTRSVNEKQSCRKDSSSSKQEKETATQSQSEKPVKTPSISSTRKKNFHEAEDLSFTPHYAKKQEKSDTLETCKGCNTPLVSDRSLGCEPETTCLDRNMENTGVTKNGCIEKEEKTKVEKSTKKLELDNKDIKVNCEKLKLTGKESDVKENFELGVNYWQVADEDLEVKNKELESVSTEYELIHKELNSDLELALVKTKNNEIEPNSSHLISNNESQASDKQFRSQVDESVLSNKKIESQVKELERTTPQLCEESVNIKKSEPEDPEPKVMDQTISNIELEPESSKTLEVIKQYKPNKKELPKIKKEETSHEETGIGTRTRSAIRSGQVAPSMRATRSQMKTTMVESAGKVKTEANKETSDKTPQKFSKEKMDQEPGQVCEQEVCLQNNLLIETVKSTTVCEKYQHCTILKNKAGEELGNGDSQGNTLLKMTAELHKEKKENEDCKKNTLLAEEYKEDAERENRNFRKNKLFSAVQEEEDGCTAGERKLEHCKKKKVVDVVTQKKTTEGQPQSILMENNQNISFEENQPRTSLLEHLQDTSQRIDKAGHFHRGHKFADIPRKEECNNIKHENSPKCVHQVSQEDVANTSQTEDKCEICQNTIKEESKPTKAKDDENRNGCRESNSSKEDTNLSQTLDIKDNKRPLEAAEECAMKRKKEPAVGLGSTEHKNNEEKGKYLCKKGEIKEDGDERKNNVADTEMEETKTLEDISKGSSSKEVKRYSKVVVVGDARMTLLATSDIKEQLQEVTQVIVVPNLTLCGILEVVQREVVKEECPRGILLLCLAGVLGTLVECQVPQECKTAGHSDMHEMVPTTKGNSLDPEFPKQLATLKRKLQDTLGRGSSVLFFPVLPIDMTNFNEIAAKHHFDATGHKLEHLSQSGSLHYQLLQQYKKAVEEVNGSSVTYVRLVRFEFGSRGSCRKFTDELLQDGFSPTLDLVERYIVPQLQHVINMSNSLRFQQVALVGNACLAQVVKMQQQKGVEPCSFILQEEPGLRNLTPDSPAVKWLSGMCNALIFLSVTLKDLVTLKGESDREKTHCFLPHDPSKAFDNFLQEALRVDQMLCSLTHHCTIITTPVIPLIHQILTKDMARKTFCDKCTKTAKLVTVAIEQVSKMLNQKNGLPVWNLNYALQKNKDVHSSSHQSSSLNSKVVQKAASTWECFLNCSQACIRVMPKVTITSVLQDHKLLSSLLPNAREISRTHCNKKETQSSHSRHRTQTQSNHSRNEQTHNRSSRERKQTHNSSSRNKEHIHNGSSIDRAQTQRSCSIDRKQKSASACSALSNSTSCIFSPVQEEHIIYDVNNHSSKCVSDQYYTYMESSPPSSPDLSSHNNFMYSSHVGPSQTRKEEQNIGSLSLTLTEPQENTEPLNLISSELQKHFITDLTSLSSHERPAVRGIKDNSSSPQELCHAQQVMPSISSCQKESYPHSESMEIEFSSCTHSNSDSCGDQDRSRERNRKSIKENIKPRNQSTRKSGDGSNIKSRGRSFSLKERPYGRNPRIASSAKLCLSPKRKPTYRQSLSRSLSPLWCRYESFSEDKEYISGDRRFTSRDIRSASRSRRSVSRNKRSISTGRRSNSKGRRSISRNRSVSRGRSMSWGRSISWDKICIPRRRSSILRGRRSLPRSKRFISKSKRSISRSRLAVLRSKRSFSRSRSISRSERSISREKRSSSKSKRSVSKDWRSISRRLIHKSKRSISRSRYISRGKKISSRSRSISRSGTSISRDKRSSSRSRKSTSRDGPYLSGDRMSILRSRKSFSVKRRSIPRGKMSFSKSRKSTSRGRRSLSSNESVSRFIEKRKRSLSSSRSVSKDKTSRRYISRNRRSISRSRRCISKNKRSLSRSRSFSRGRQSISRERIPISRNRRSISRSSRSISRGKKSVLRDRRNRSNILVVHNSVRLAGHMQSAKQENTSKKRVKEALGTLWSIHEKECEMYRSNPSIHPDIGVEYRLFCDKKTQSILALGGDPTLYNMAHDWHSFWKKRIEEIFIESWRLKRKQCLALLDANQKPPSPQPSSRTHHSYSVSSSSSCSSSFSSFSTSSSSSFFSSSSSSSSGVQQRKTSKKTWKNRFSQGSKRMRKKHETKTLFTETNPRGKKVRTSSVSHRYEERHPSDYSGSTLPGSESSEEDWEVKDCLIRKVADISRETKKKKQVKKLVDRLPYSSPCVIQPRNKGQNQNIGKSCKKTNRNPPSPPQISGMDQQELYDKNKQWLIERLLNSFPCQTTEKSCKKINRNPLNPPQISGMNQQRLDDKHKERVTERLSNSSPCAVQLSREGLSQSTKKSCKKINREPPSPPHISRMSQQELYDKHKQWCLPSPPNQSTIHGESQQYTFKHNIIDHISIDKQSPTSTITTEEAKLEQPGQQRVKSHISVLDHWLHLSSQECITVSSGRPEIAISEAQEKQDSHKHSDPNMVKENRKKTFTDLPNWYNESSGCQKKNALFTSSQGDPSYRSTLKLNTMLPISQMTNNAASSQAKEFYIHYNGNYTESEPGESHTTLTEDQNSSETITHIFKNFPANTHTKPSTVESTTQDHEDKVSSITASNESIKIDVIDVLKVLLLLEDQIGAICAPLKQILVVAKDLQSSGTNPLIILNGKDNKMLLQIIQEKLQSLLRESKLSIIKKVIMEEAKQQLAMLLEHQEPHKLFSGLNVTQLASHCLNMDVIATLTYICEVLQTQGRTHVPQEQLVNLYKSVEAEKLTLRGSSCNNRTSTATNWTESSCLQLLGDSMNPDSSVLKVAFVGHEEIPTHFALDGCEVKIYRAPGGTARNFLSDPRMNKILQWTHDLTILFLGSNDIHQDCEAVFIADKITQVADLITQTCNSKIAITLIEPWKNHNSKWVSEEFYYMVSKAINEKLETNMKEQFFINLSTKLYSADMQKYGKHWNDEWRTFKEHEFQDIILKFKQSHEVIRSVIGSGEKS